MRMAVKPDTKYTFMSWGVEVCKYPIGPDTPTKPCAIVLIYPCLENQDSPPTSQDLGF